MLRMALGHSDDVDVEDALDAVLEQCARALGDAEPVAGLLLVTHESDPGPLIEGVRKAHPDVELVGSTSAAEMSSVGGFQEGSVVLALFASDSIAITGGLGTGVGSDPVGAARHAVREAMGKTDLEPRLCITAPAPHQDPLALLRGFREELGDAVPVLGGISSATIEQPATAAQFCDDRVVQDGVPVLVFSGPLASSFGVDNGWRPVGKPGRVTKVSDGLVEEIDGRPALEFYERYLGPGAGPSPANPLAVFEEGSDDFYLRAAAAHDEATGSIVIFGGPPVNSTVQLAVTMTDEIFEGTRSAIRKARQAFPADATPEAGLIFSCMIRKLLLGTKTGTEIDIARGELGEAMPLCGFYSYGEIAPIESGSTQFHNETIVAVLLGTE
jgi:hypothetical protein